VTKPADLVQGTPDMLILKILALQALADGPLATV
jgi:hypothetical protein